MITEIKLKNFKCFAEETIFPLNKLNLLTGINGRGKSTLLQSLLIMRQTIEHSIYSNEIILNGNLLQLGSYNDVKNIDISNDNIILTYLIDNEIQISYDLKDKKDSLLIEKCSYNGEDLNLFIEDKKLIGNSIDFKINENLYNILINNKKINFNLINPFYNLEHIFVKKNGNKPTHINFKNIHYISADRIGPQDFYKKTNLGEFVNVGSKGENTANVLFQNKNKKVFQNLYLSETENTENTDYLLETQIGLWISKILDTENIKVFVEEIKANIFILSFKFGNNQINYKPSNVGFGYSYILPIIVSGLIAKEGEVLIVENPEAHLHPKAQHELTLFLAKVASIGVQVFIESHSEHILNAVRISTLQNFNILKNNDISILYFKNIKNEENVKNEQFVQIPVLENGEINSWLDGFFDQTDKDYKILYNY